MLWESSVLKWGKGIITHLSLDFEERLSQDDARHWKSTSCANVNIAESLNLTYIIIDCFNLVFTTKSLPSYCDTYSCSRVRRAKIKAHFSIFIYVFCESNQTCWTNIYKVPLTSSDNLADSPFIHAMLYVKISLLFYSNYQCLESELLWNDMNKWERFIYYWGLS